MDHLPLKSYRDLRVWQEAMTLAELCYRLSREFPKDELYGMTSQIRRAAASVPANIAEAYGVEAGESTSNFYESRKDRSKKLKRTSSFRNGSNWPLPKTSSRFLLSAR